MTEPARPFRLFPRASEASLDAALFASPTMEYRGTPFWCWNDRLDRPRLLRQLEINGHMGFGGFHVHSRTGLATEYLGETWMNLVSMCADEAATRQMRCWLYDEDRWPSGYAGGLTTRDERFRQRQLLWTRTPYGQNAPRGKSDYTTAIRNETGRLLARYDVELDPTHRLARFKRLRQHETAAADRVIWYAYLEPATPSTWFNGQTAVDVFSREAIERFIATTHERYRQHFDQREDAGSEAFGTTIPGFFTDEPQFTKKSMFKIGDEMNDLFMPFSEDFADTYRAAFGDDLLDQLPELFWNLPGDAPSLARYRYHEHTAERFASGFSDTLGDWCERNGVVLTGHMLGEANLMSQTRGCGEAMRGLRSFQLPGVDMLCDKREFTTLLQARSVARQFGREGVASELYGVTGWHFDFVGHKAQGDWQAALGVTHRVPHLFWMSMRGEAKRDYPASIGEQSPWFAEYPLIEDHFARVATVMTRGMPMVNVAVIHPIESAWLCWGPQSQNEDVIKRLDSSFTQLPEWLLFAGIDFDYLSESLLAREGAEVIPATETGADTLLRFGKMRYACVVVPPTLTLRSTTLDLLERFVDAGGDVVFAGDIARGVDVSPNNRAEQLAARTHSGPCDSPFLSSVLDRWRFVRFESIDGSTADGLLHQVRADGACRYLFVVNTCRAESRHVRIRVPGHWTFAMLDTMNGNMLPLCRWERDATSTYLEHTFSPHGHLLLTLTPGGPDHLLEFKPMRPGEPCPIEGPVPVTLEEPNVVVLDRAELLPSPHVQPRELTDILVLDNLIRDDLKLPRRTGRGVQPWADASPAPVLSNIRLRFVFETEIDLEGVELAMEDPEEATIHLDGQLLSNVPTGWWVDQAIQRVALPSMKAGPHDLCLTIPFTRKTELEACYLLGDFGVRAEGASIRIVPPVRQLNWGDWTTQGLPFYGGNVHYHVPMPEKTTRGTTLACTMFRNPLLSVASGGETIGKIAFAPFDLALPAGIERIDITAFGNRANTFGPLHHTDRQLKWIGPAAWRSTGAQWTDDYCLKEMGILSAPTLSKEA